MAAMDGGFDVTVPLAKVWEDEDGAMRFEGVASSTSLDRQHERMTINAINKMAGQVGLDLLPSHQAGPLEELGTVEQAWVDNDQFRVAGRLEPNNTRSRRLFEKVSAGERYGLSVGGRVTKAFWRHDPELGRQVRHIEDVELDHVAVCRAEQAANPDTYLTTLAKAAEGLMDEAVDEEAMLARVGRAAVGAARSLWPFAKDEDEPGTEQIDELKTLRDDVDDVKGTLAELQKAMDERAERERETTAQGRSRAIPGQERCETEDPWRGVV